MNNTCVCVVCYVILHANTCITLLLPLHQTGPVHDDDADTNIGLYTSFLPPYQTMDLSTMTMPIALLILAVMVSNVRLVICTVISLLACLAGSILIMLPITKVMTV